MVADAGCGMVEAESPAMKMIPAEEKATFVESVCLEEEAHSQTKMIPVEEKEDIVDSVCVEVEARSPAIEKLLERRKLESKGKAPTVEEYIPPEGFNGYVDFRKLEKARKKTVFDIMHMGIKYYNKKMNANLEFVKLVKVNLEIVAGVLYYITFKGNDGGKISTYECQGWTKFTSPKVEARTGNRFENVVMLCRKKLSGQGRGLLANRKAICGQGCSSCEECNDDFGLNLIFG